MGNASSIFYPDNPKRYRRAQQLSDDCKYAQDQYDAAKKRLEDTLGPYKEKLDKLLNAFGCRNIDDFDQLVQSTATGEALERWNKTRTVYDKGELVDQIFMAAEGIVTVVGLTVSIIGAAAGGFGFFVGIGVTADILIVLGLFNVIFDAINGAIQREKLQDAINKLVPVRIKAKYNQMQMDQLLTSLPSIQVVYQAFEEVGYDKDKILQKFKDHDWLKSLRTESTKITYTKAGKELEDMDVSRGSWRDEDPSWTLFASFFDGAMPSFSSMTTMLAVPAAVTLKTASVDLIQPVSSVSVSSTMKDEDLLNPPPPYDGHISIRFIGTELANSLQETFHVIFEDFEGDRAARVRINTKDDQSTLVANINDSKVYIGTSVEPTSWIMRFANPDDAVHFTLHGKDPAHPDFPDTVEVHLYAGDLYVAEDGSLVKDWQKPSTILKATYA